jgi:hypothetical protein
MPHSFMLCLHHPYADLMNELAPAMIMIMICLFIEIWAAFKGKQPVEKAQKSITLVEASRKANNLVSVRVSLLVREHIIHGNLCIP